MKNNIKLKTIFRIAGIIVLAAIIGFSMAACGGDDDNPNPNPNPDLNPNPNPDDQIVLTMKFKENPGWNGTQGTSEDWERWNYDYQDENKSLDLSSAYSGNKVYVFNYSFTSDQDIKDFSVYFFRDNPDWKMLSDSTSINVFGTVKKNNKYTGRIPIFPNSNASGSNKQNIYLRLLIKDRDVATPATLSFYQFSLEPVAKETAGLAKWTVSGKDIKVTDTRRTKAENLSSYQGKNNVFHIKPTYNASTYDHIVMEYDLSAYSGKKIGVEMSFDSYINKEARVAWQMLIAPDYPLVCGYIDSTYFLTANTWQNISGNTIVDVPASGDKKLYLSGMQINGAEAYFANATLTITEGTSTPDTPVTLNSVTADGSSSSKTTQLTLTFSQAITGLTAANINLGSSISGLTKGTLSGSGTTYTLPISGFTTGGNLSVSVSKLSYNITPSKTVTIYGGSGGTGGGGGQNDPGDLAGTWTGKIGSYDATITVSGSGWTMTASGTSFYDSGYFVRNGNTATLYLSSGTNNGTATLINSTTIQVVLNSNTIFPGTYTLTKQGGSTGGGGTFPENGTLAQKLAWLSENAVNNTTYTITVTADESVPRTTFTAGKFTNVTILLKGDTTMRTVSPSSTGGLFTIGSGVTLILDNNITLRGLSNNNTRLVGVSGKLEMREGSRITGNSNSSPYYDCGGVYVTGIFNMLGGEISNNTVYSSSEQTSGGGVCVDGGTFTMSGGKISGNTLTSTGSNSKYTSLGAGVCVWEGTFNMTGGEISGNTASSNVNSYGGGVFIANGASFSKTGGTIYGYTSGDSNSNTVKVNSSVKNGNGHAAFRASGNRYRDTTAGTSVNLSSSSTSNWN